MKQVLSEFTRYVQFIYLGRHKHFIRLVLFCCFIVSPHIQAQNDEVIRLSDTITGNQEQPKVLYVIPWQKAEDKSILYQSLESNFDTVFDTVEEAEHKREIEFLNSFLEQTKSQ